MKKNDRQNGSQGWNRTEHALGATQPGTLSYMDLIMSNALNAGRIKALCRQYFFVSTLQIVNQIDKFNKSLTSLLFIHWYTFQ